MTEITTAIFSAIGGFITAFLAFKKDDKSNQLKHITDERKEWRVKIRKLVVKFLEDESINLSEAKLRRIRTEIAINLNPTDDEDNYILKLMDDYIINQSNELHVEISKAFATLLKHDWERAKNEAKSEKIFSPLKVILFCFVFYKAIPLIIKINELFSTQCPFKQECLLKSIACFLCCIICAILFYMAIISVYNRVIVKIIERRYKETTCITIFLNINVRKKLSK